MTDHGAWAVLPKLDEVAWRKSTFSGVSECVLVAECGESIAICNSLHPDAGTLLLPRGGVAAWIAGCRNGEFDHLT